MPSLTDFSACMVSNSAPNMSTERCISWVTAEGSAPAAARRCSTGEWAIPGAPAIPAGPGAPPAARVVAGVPGGGRAPPGMALPAAGAPAALMGAMPSGAAVDWPRKKSSNDPARRLSVPRGGGVGVDDGASDDSSACVSEPDDASCRGAATGCSRSTSSCETGSKASSSAYSGASCPASTSRRAA